MKYRNRWIAAGAAVGMTLTAAFVMVPAAQAEEPAEAFVSALVDNGYYDVAIDYLGEATKSDLVVPEFRSTIPFELARVLVRSTAVERSEEAREQKFNEADRLLNDYAASLDDPREKANVLLASANIKVRRAEVQILRALSNQRLNDAEKEEARSQADRLLRAALPQFESAQDQVRTLLKNFRLDTADPKSGREKSRLEKQYLEIRTQRPLVLERLADTLPAGSAEQKKLLKEALKENEEVYEKYRRFRQTFVYRAAIHGARSSQKLGEHARALEMLEDVFELGDGVAEEELKKAAMTVAVDSWAKTDPYPADVVIARLEPAVSQLNRNGQRDPEWQRIELELSRARLIRAKEVAADGGSGSVGRAKQLTSEASKSLRRLARGTPEVRDLAQALAGEFDVQFNEAATDAAVATVTTFEAAKAAAETMIAEIVDLQNQIRQQRRTADASETASMKQSLASKIQAAFGLYEKALSLTDEKTSIEDINFIRFQQSICYFIQGKPLQSAVIAEYLFYRYPSVNWTRQASAYMVKGYSSLAARAEKSDGNDGRWESEKLQMVCREIATRYPDSEEASIAAATLVKSAIRSRDMATAREFLDQIPDSFSGKLALSAALGQRIWFDVRDDRSVDPAARDREIERAKKMLQFAVQPTPEGVSYLTASASLTLIDILLSQGKVADAVQQLENGDLSPLKLIQSNHPAITQPAIADSFQQAAYRTAIKTYLAAIAGDIPGDFVGKTTGVLDQMRSTVDSSDPTQAKKLTAMYQAVGQQLSDQFDELKTPAEREKFATVLSDFVSSVQKGASDSRTLLWAGQTLLKVADSMRESGAADQAKPLYQQATAALEQAQKTGGNDAATDIALRYQQAIAMRGSGQFAESIATFVELLKKKSSLSIQIDAARTLEMWGLEQKSADALAKAMMGDGRYTEKGRQKNAIWGWRKLVQLTRGKDNLNDAFRESLFHSIKSRFEYGRLKQNTKAVASARSELEKSLQRFDFLQTGVWAERFESLANEINASPLK